MIYYKTFYSYGKLLLTGEYLIINGSWGIALSTCKGQRLNIFFSDENNTNLHWKSFDENSKLWFEVIFEIPSLNIIYTSEKKLALILKKILIISKKLQKNFLSKKKGFLVESKLEFPKNWGLGSSSTLINNIAQWAGINPYKLFWSSHCFSGSGYDIACAIYGKTILYNINNKNPAIIFTKISKNISKHLYFIYLNKKINSNKAVKIYNKKKISNKNIMMISLISKMILSCNNIDEFEELILYHEKLISKILDIKTIKEKYFKDFSGNVKSLGAWGGDFMLAIIKDYKKNFKNMKKYFYRKGYNTIIPFNNIIL